MNATYILSGVVHPERADVNVQRATARAHGAPNIDGELVFSIYKSRLIATYTGNALANPEILRHFAEDAARAIVDTLGFTNGCGYDIEIVQLIDPETHAHWVFGVEEPVVASLNVGDRLPATTVASLGCTPFAPYLHRCFGDLREAIRSYRDTAFFCYRAVECLMHYYWASIPDKPKADAWQLFRESLSVSESKLRNIKSAADPLRHGKPDSALPFDRNAILAETWAIVEKFVVHALSESGTEHL